MPNRARELRRPDADQALTRAAIVSAGVEIADHEGLRAVSIRRVADRLSARPMSLYTYIASKDELLALMADQIVAEVIVPGRLPRSWREALRRIARRSHATFVAHPWVLEISGRRPDLGANALRHAEQMLAAIAPLKLTRSDAWSVLFIVNDYTLGHALRVAQAAAEPGVGFPEFDRDEFPLLASASPARGSRGAAARGEATFTPGLEAVLDGIERRFLAG